MLPARAGGVYIPPFKMRAILEDLKNKESTSIEHQKYMWEMLRKSINGIVNKVNTSNIQNIILELFNENLLRSKGLLSRAVMKA
jgi:pre-mRNA-splicing factor CWC22